MMKTKLLSLALAAVPLSTTATSMFMISFASADFSTG